MHTISSQRRNAVCVDAVIGARGASVVTRLELREDGSALASPTPAELFASIWDALTDVIGPAATATLVRRALKGCRGAELEGVVVTREKFDYRCVVPAAWNTHSDAAMVALRELTTELESLLGELTGAVVLQRLRRLPEVERCQLFRSEVEP